MSAAETRAEDRLYRANRLLAHGFYAITRRLGPVVRVPSLGTVVNDGEIARAILATPDVFTSSGPGSLGALITTAFGPAALINMDGPAHKALKTDLAQVFSPRFVDAVAEAAAGPRLAALDRALRAGETVDFAAFMRDYGCAMACALIGLRPDPGHEAAAFADIFHLATEIMAFAGTAPRRLSPGQAATARALAARLAAHIATAFALPDPPPHSLTARLRGQGLAFETVRDMVLVVLIGAVELIVYGLPRALAVIVDSGSLPALQADPGKLDAAIDEALRVTTPSNAILRSVAANHSIAGHHFRAGTRVIIVFRNIMRDPARFADPGRFDMARANPWRRLIFGAGPHACLGAALTLAEMRQVLGLVAALPNPLEIGERRFNRGKLYPGYTRLDVRMIGN
jgi:cytochrome P450